MLDGGQKPVLLRPRDPKRGLGCRAIEKKGLCVGGVGRERELGISMWSVPKTFSILSVPKNIIIFKNNVECLICIDRTIFFRGVVQMNKFKIQFNEYNFTIYKSKVKTRILKKMIRDRWRHWFLCFTNNLRGGKHIEFQHWIQIKQKIYPSHPIKIS